MIRPPKIPSRSPSGAPTCPNVGPLNARIVTITESPGETEIKDQIPLVGLAGKLYNKGLLKAGIDRSEVRIINPIPCLAPGNEFAKHDPRDVQWGMEILEQEFAALEPVEKRIVVLMGNHPMEIVLGLHGIMNWRGSLFPPVSSLRGDSRNEYWTRLVTNPVVPGLRDAAHISTYHPAAVLRQMPWHVWFNNDLIRAKRWVEGRDYELKYREWHIEQPAETHRLIYDVILPHEHLVGIDTEMDPPLISLVTEEEVHAFVFNERYRGMLTDLMSSRQVLKVAHNMAHDWRQFEKWFGIRVERPYYDSMCLAHIMEPSGDGRTSTQDKSAGRQLVGKKLSPHIATRYTPWPYHKWLVDVDPHVYCGIDTVVAYDAYWSQVNEATPEQIALAEFDAQVFPVLFDMMRRGIRVDEGARQGVMAELAERCASLEKEFKEKADYTIKSQLKQARKKHLFLVERKCACCRGAKKKLHQCWACAGFSKSPTKKELVERVGERGSKSMDVETLKSLVLSPCKVCEGKGDYEEWQEFNLSSPDQVSDLFYRMLGVPPRTFEGSETIRIEQLERLLDDGQWLSSVACIGAPKRQTARELLTIYRNWSYASIDHDTAKRITPGEDGRIRCNFDLWYVPTGRVASRETLLDAGTNIQNIPKEARKLFIPSDGMLFLYPDYKQVEGRSIAVITQDPHLLEEYEKPNADSHALVARLVSETGITLTRDQAKRTFFATIYGVEAPHLADILGCSVPEAQGIINGIFKAFPGTWRYRERIKQQILEERSVTVIDGWKRRWLGHVMVTKGRKKGTINEKVLKEGLATPPQRMGARVLAQGLVNATSIQELYPVAHVHDASLSEAPIHLLHDIVPRAEEQMAVTLWGMHFPVDMSLGPNWYIASIPDKDKEKMGYGEWTKAKVLG